MLIKLPKRFFDDHADRELPTPEVVSETARYYVVDRADPALPELLSDADYYSDGVDCCERGLVRSAIATATAIRAALA